MSDAAVVKATGRAWPAWFALLDNDGAASLPHPRITGLVQKRGASPWWSQMIAVQYERARGLRDVNQKADGYSASSSRTIEAPVSALFRAWYDPTSRRSWIGDAEITIRRATPDKSLRITWHPAAGPETPVEVNFYPKGPGRSQLAVQHNKLPSRRAFEQMKVYWGDRLGVMKAMLEGSPRAR